MDRDSGGKMDLRKGEEGGGGAGDVKTKGLVSFSNDFK